MLSTFDTVERILATEPRSVVGLWPRQVWTCSVLEIVGMRKSLTFDLKFRWLGFRWMEE